MNKNNSTGHPGVCFESRPKKYRAYISIARERLSLGYYHTLSEAIKARQDAENLYRIDKHSRLLSTPEFWANKPLTNYVEKNLGVAITNASLWAVFRMWVRNKADRQTFASFAIQYIRRGELNYYDVKKAETEYFGLEQNLPQWFTSMWLQGASLRNISTLINKSLDTLIKELKDIKDIVEG